MLLLLSIILFLIIFTRPITVLFHELGHGVTALLLTKDKITLYIGSYGNPKNSFNIQVGRLEFFLKYNPVFWKLGLCVFHGKSITTNRQMLILLSGPLASLFLAFLCYYVAFESNFHNGIVIICVVILISAIFDFVINIIPSNEPIHLYNGSIVYNDGRQLKQLLELNTLPPEYAEGEEYYVNQEYEKASKCFQNIISRGISNANVYRLIISSYMQLKDYEKALKFHQVLEEHYIINSNDYGSLGLAKSHLGYYKDGITNFNKSLDLNPNNKFSLNNRGYTFNILEEYNKAISDFDHALKIDPESAYTFNNRGLAKIKLGREEEGLKDIETSMSMDDKNSYAYKNLGIYYFDKKNFDEALKLFEKSYEFDNDTHLIKDYIDKAKKML